MKERDFINWLDGYLDGISDMFEPMPKLITDIKDKLSKLELVKENTFPITYTHPTTTLKD
jgi:hypothetical protein